MPRNLTTGMLSALTSPGFSPAFFVSLTFSTGTAYLWSGVGTISWNGQSWLGLGSLLSVGLSEDGSTIEARGMSITLSGIDSTLLSDCLNDIQLGLPATIWLAAMSGGAPVANPFILWSGAMDRPTVEISADTAKITLNLENLLVSMNVPVDRRYTQVDQQELYPGDDGLNFAQSIQECTIFWGLPITTGNI